MAIATFDTLRTAKRLKEAGFTESQAERLVEIYEEILESNLATKTDLQNVEKSIKELEVGLKRDMKEFEGGFKRDMKELDSGLKRDMKELEMRMTIKLGSIMVIGISVVVALMKLL